jgi:hypothetical protein
MHIEPTNPTPATVRSGRVPRGAVLPIAALVCAALIGACGSSSSTSTTKTNVNTSRVAASIEHSVLVKRHLHTTVVCPTAVPQEKGKTFECIATSTATKAPFAVTKTPFVVTVQNNAGYVTYVGK